MWMLKSPRSTKLDGSRISNEENHHIIFKMSCYKAVEGIGMSNLANPPPQPEILGKLGGKFLVPLPADSIQHKLS